ncbi:hypothetical protein ACI782_22640 [Geodermatophilus sp. SYSU D00703]
MLAGAVDHHDEVIRVTHESINRAAALADASASHAGSGRLPLLGEVIVESGQGDVGQQWGEDSSNAVGNFCFDEQLHLGVPRASGR